MSGPAGTRSSRPDAIVIGSGPNGLVGANMLADAGWSVLVLEAQPTPGGAVRSDRGVHPDFVHDTFSAFYPLAVASQAMLAMDLESYGVTWEHAPAPLGHPLPDGRWALLHHDREATAAGLDEQYAGDGEGWLELCALWDRLGAPLIDAVTTPFPPVGAGLRMAARLPGAGGLATIRTLASPAASLARRFGGDAPGLLLAGNAAHADIPLDSPGSGVFGLILAMLAQTVGFPVPRGGAGELSGALVRRLEERGGRVVCEAEVTRIEVDGGRVSAVRTAEERHALAPGGVVLADVGFQALYGALLAPEDVPAKVRRQQHTFELDPATIKVDWALSGPVPWASEPAVAPGTVHIADSLGELTEALAQVGIGRVPDHPFLLAGQMTTTDPTRSPAGTESLWAYTHVPQGGDWDHDACERYADVVQERWERLAPGFGSRVLARRVLGPHELEARDANLVGGAIDGGTAQVQQELFFRPVPALLGRPETGVAGLYLASAAAHPGGGVHGAAGANAARAALLHHRAGALARPLRTTARGLGRRLPIGDRGVR